MRNNAQYCCALPSEGKRCGRNSLLFCSKNESDESCPTTTPLGLRKENKTISVTYCIVNTSWYTRSMSSYRALSMERAMCRTASTGDLPLGGSRVTNSLSVTRKSNAHTLPLLSPANTMLGSSREKSQAQTPTGSGYLQGRSRHAEKNNTIILEWDTLSLLRLHNVVAVATGQLECFIE